jgi:O-antigen/teichoic acid export membrane protein
MLNMKIKNFYTIKSLFFENKSIKQTIFKNTFWLAAASAINKFLKFVLFIYIARILGATEFGKFTFALAFAGLFIIFADFGLSQITTRELAREKEKEKEFSAILSLKILLCLGTLILILIGSFFITPDPLIQKIIWILAICLLAGNFSGIIFAFFQARQKMEYQALASVLETLLVTGVGLFILFNFPSVENLSYSYLFAALVVLIFVLIFFHFKIQKIFFSWDKLIWKKFLLMSWPLALAGMAGAICNQTDSVMMGYFGQINQTGWYNAAYRIITVTLIPVGFISASFYPVLSKSFGESKERLQKVWNYNMKIIIFFGVPLVVGGMVLAPKIINFVYNSEYLPSVLAFQILTIMAGIIFLYTPFYSLLVVSDHQKKIFWAVFLGATINVVLNLILIPKFSLYGAAFATIITQFLIFLLLLRFTLKFTLINPFNFKLFFSLIVAFLSGLVMYIAISRPQIFNLHVLFSILVGTLVYFFVLFSLIFTIRKIKYFYEKV